jgi:hypothetical protein
MSRLTHGGAATMPMNDPQKGFHVEDEVNFK